MADAKASASGPLWAVAYNDDGMITDSDGVYTECRDAENTAQWLSDGGGRVASAVPCRLLPGHGKWVPVELVEAIEQAYNGSWEDENAVYAAIEAAIRAAKEGGV